MTPNADAAACSTASFRKARLEGTPLSRSRHQCALARPESRGRGGSAQHVAVA